MDGSGGGADVVLNDEILERGGKVSIRPCVWILR